MMKDVLPPAPPVPPKVRIIKNGKPVSNCSSTLSVKVWFFLGIMIGVILTSIFLTKVHL